MNSKLKLKIVRKNDVNTIDFDEWDVILVVSGDTFKVAQNMVIEENPDTEHKLSEINDYGVECHQVFSERYYINSNLTHDKSSFERIL